MARKNRLFAKLASDVDTSGNLAASGIQSEALDIGVTVYATRANLPTSGNTAGDQAYVTGNNRLYIWNGSGWYNVALLNVAPAISSVTDSDGGVSPFSLSTNGTATTITITAADPDGDPITYSATADSDFNGLATLSQADNVFTITPFSQDSATTSSGTITFTATDGINIGSSGIQTFTLQFAAELWKDAIFSIGTNSTTGLLNHTFIDRSTNASTVTTNGAPVQTAFHPYLDNWSVEFDGSTDWLQTASSNITDMGTGDFTIECWFSRTAAAGNSYHDIILSNREDASFTAGEWSVYVDPTDGGSFGFQANNASIVSGGTCVTGQWHHIAVVRSSGTITLYVDGVSVGTASNTSQIGTTSKILNVGAFGNGGYKCKGYVSNVRLVNGTAVYTSAFTVSLEKLTAVSGTTFLGLQSNRFIDNSSNNISLTVNGTPEVSAYNPFGQLSEYASGGNRGSYYATNNGFLSIDGSSIDFTQNWTIECWVYYDASAIGSHIVSSINAGSGVDGLYFLNASDFYITTNGSGWGMSFQADAYLKRYSWHHCALTWDGNTYTAWIDGISRSTYSSTSPVSFSSQAIGVGATSNGTGNFGGYISDFNITTGTAKYTTTFTPPLSPVGNTNADLYLPMDNAGIYDKTGNETLVNVGTGMKTANGQTKYASTSVYVQSGSSAYNSVNSITLNDFTVEFWIYTGGGDISTTTYDIITIGEANINSGADFYIYQNNLRIWNNAGYLLVPAGLTTNAWHHIAFVRSGTTVTGYANGSSVGTDTMSNTLSGVIHFGGYYTNVYSRYLPVGTYIENLQIFNTAKYTSNFTPPTLTQGRTYQAES